MTDDFQLNDRAKAWIRGIKSRFAAAESPGVEAATEAQSALGAFKIL